MQVIVRLLGGFEVAVDGHTVPGQTWNRRPAAALVKLLALQPQRRLPRERVIDALWPDLLVEDALPRLHKAAHFARTALGVRDGIVASGGSIALFPGVQVTLDVEEFERAAESARTGGRDAARQAVALYPGDLLPDDLYEPWTDATRSRLRLRHLELLAAAGMFEELVAADPLDEEAHLALVRDHVRAGRRQPALAALDRLTDTLERELGVPPGPAAEELRSQAAALAVPLPDPDAAGTEAGPAPAPQARLPAPRARLIGRADDLAAVSSLLREHRIVTITGPGGAGKSTLALAVARALEEDGTTHGPVEVALAPLAPVHDAAGVVRAVAEATGVQGEGAVRSSSLAANLATRRLLLVLDNCEHLLDPSAELVDAILDAGPRARVLVTSREPLRVDGEAEHRIGSLGPESVNLFVERAAAAAGPGIVDAGDPRVSVLCQRLDGLPLAIELAAAQLRHLALGEIIDRLDDRLTLLVGGRPQAGERHSALSATIEWSHRLLDEGTRDVFDRLGVFPGGFDLAAVRAVTQDPDAGHVTNLLGDLVAKSLVVHDPQRRRYRLLETIRLFAAQSLDRSGEAAATTERLRRHAVTRATTEPRARAWLSTSLAARSRDDLDNVRFAFEASLAAGDRPAAVDLAIGLSTLWRNAVSYAEGRRWIDALLGSDLAPRDRLWTLIMDADVCLGFGDARSMRRAAVEATTLAGAVDDEGAAVIAAIYEAMVHLDAPDRAAERLLHASARAREAGEPGLERLARGYRVVALRMLGTTDGLREEALALTDDAPDRDYARYLCHWAASLVALVDRDGAWLHHLMEQQRSDLSATGLHENWLTLYWGALALIAQGGDYLPELRRARAWAAAEGRSAEADCVLALAYAAACRDGWEEAAELLGATEGSLLHGTASFIHQALLGEQLVKPRLGEAYAEVAARGRHLSHAQVLADRGL
ncbi:ATP-binding protein [Nocardioides euryhalodurans]|nr:BTAD domain-containing putative transcriptional regulator [Nocardioides euryhalodurans]